MLGETECACRANAVADCSDVRYSVCHFTVNGLQVVTIKKDERDLASGALRSGRASQCADRNERVGSASSARSRSGTVVRTTPYVGRERTSYATSYVCGRSLSSLRWRAAASRPSAARPHAAAHVSSRGSSLRERTRSGRTCSLLPRSSVVSRERRDGELRSHVSTSWSSNVAPTAWPHTNTQALRRQ